MPMFIYVRDGYYVEAQTDNEKDGMPHIACMCQGKSLDGGKGNWNGREKRGVVRMGVWGRMSASHFIPL